MDIEAKLAELDARERTSEHRLRDLETEMRDLHALTKAVAITNTNVQQLQHRVEELHADIKGLTAVPMRRWNTVIEWLIKGTVGALVGALIATVLK